MSVGLYKLNKGEKDKQRPHTEDEIYLILEYEAGKLPMIKGVSLETLLEQYEEIQEMFRHVCLNKTDDNLTEIVPFENGNRATTRWGIWHIADHSRHHYANIAQLKKMVCV